MSAAPKSRSAVQLANAEDRAKGTRNGFSATIALVAESPARLGDEGDIFAWLRNIAAALDEVQDIVRLPERIGK